MKNEFKKPGILTKIRDNYIYQIMVCIVLSFLVIFVFFIVNKAIDFKKFRKYTVVEDINLVNSIEDIKIDDNKLTFTGYAFIANKNSNDNKISMFLINKSNGQEVWLDIKQIDRPDVNKYYGNDFDFTNSGFIATAIVDKINKNDVYEVFLNIDYTDMNKNSVSKNKRITVSTNFYLLNNKLFTYNPIEVETPDLSVESNLLKDVFANGDLYFYSKDIGMYIYEYQEKLYWIANEDYMFSKDGMTGIIYHLYTTQENKLPEHRVKFKFDNLDFIFEKHEYKNEVTKPYRVAISKIPKEYPITYIKTGVYDAENKKWVWLKHFHLRNILSNQ